jgi:predicted DNA-binding transcriptional regulator AlpA
MDNQYYSILDKLDRIEQKLDSKQTNKYLSIIQVADLTSLSTSTIRRSVAKSHLKCSKKLGKLLFLESDVRKWLNG